MKRSLQIKKWEMQSYYVDWCKNKYELFRLIDLLELDKESENYKQDIQIVKDIIKSNDEILIACLWNAIVLWDWQECIDLDDYDEIADFMDEQRRCYKKGYISYFNLNKEPIKGKRIEFDINCSDYQQEFFDHYRKDDMFKTYASIEPSDYSFSYYAPIMNMFNFIIKDIESGNTIGRVELYNYDSETKTAELSYYIFEEYRGKGYGKEALSLLINKAFNKELKCYQETIRKYVFKEEIANIELIYAHTSVDNIGSIKLLESLGFNRTGTIHRHEAIRENEYIDCYRYELLNGD